MDAFLQAGGAAHAGYDASLLMAGGGMGMLGVGGLAGVKRGFMGYGAASVENYVKLFVGNVPRTITEPEVREIFAEYGTVVEVALLKDRNSGLQQTCCFVKYGTLQEAERAIKGLNNRHQVEGAPAPLQVRLADGERERLGAVEYKLFVGSVTRSATEKDLEKIFAKFGELEDVYVMRDQDKRSRGCAFVKYNSLEAAQAAISALNGQYTMDAS